MVAPDPVEDLGAVQHPSAITLEEMSEVFPWGAAGKATVEGCGREGPGHLDQASASPLRASPVGDQ